jgi:hypothetical protein
MGGTCSRMSPRIAGSVLSGTRPAGYRDRIEGWGTMNRIVARPRSLLLVVALAIVAALCTASTANAASSASATPHQPATSSAQCNFVESLRTCISTDPTAAYYDTTHGDTSHCTFVFFINWGDGHSTTRTVINPTAGHHIVGENTYTARGIYTITVVPQVTAGTCTTTESIHTFILTRAAAPAAPSHLTARPVDPHHIQLRWRDNSRNETRFEISNGVVTRNVRANSTAYTWGRLAPGTRACFRIRAHNSAGDSAWDPNASYVCTTTPAGNGNSALQLPYPRGTKVSIGFKGLHGENFGSVSDDRTGKLYTLRNDMAADSLDIVLHPGGLGTTTIPTTPLRAGVVLAVWKACQVVLIDHGGGLWAIYIHQANIAVQSGQKVTADTKLGYSTTVLPSRNAHCGNVSSDAEHVHIALLKGGSSQAGSYESLLGASLCGHKVVRLNQDDRQIVLQGLTTTPEQQFAVPC